MRGKAKGRAFTLIELLIVVAIIAILALIAVPNFLEAQTRAKVAREKHDLRTINVALEAYAVDHNTYPPWTERGPRGYIHPCSWRFAWLTTPIAYITSVLWDPFAKYKEWDQTDGGRPQWDTYDLVTWNGTYSDDPWVWSHAWRVNGFGPDYVNQYGGGRGTWDNVNPGTTWTIFPNYIYDPTNGTVSFGDVIRVGARTPTTHRGYHPIETLPW